MKKTLIKIYAFFKVLFSFKKPDSSHWVLNSSNNNYFNYNSKYLAIYISENCPEITTYYVINNTELRSELQLKYPKINFISSRTIEDVNVIINCGVWITSAGLPIRGLKLNRKRLIVNLWHGVPLKRILLMENNYPLIKKLVFKPMISNNYDYIFTPSSNLIKIMANSFNTKESRIKVLGQPRNDGILNKSSAIISYMSTEYSSKTKHILYAPTFRDEYETELFPFPDFDIDKLNEFLTKNDIVIHLRVHQNEGSIVEKFLGGNILELNNDKVDDITNILNEFDLLITDYSSIYIDYLITHKPILFLPYDKNAYFKNRGLNFKYDTVTPGPKPMNQKQFLIDVEKLFYNTNYYLEERVKLNNYFNEVSSDSSRLIVEFINKHVK